MKNPFRLIDRRSLTIIIGAFTLVTLVSVIAIVLTVSARARESVLAEAERRRSEQQALTNTTSFGMEDYYLDTRDPDTGMVYPSRTPRSTWSREEVDRYWIDPEEAGLDTLESDNDRLVLNRLGLDGE